MARNIEIKAKLADKVDLTAGLKRLNAEYQARLAQTDTFFNATTGRLKLREFGQGDAELIYYQRDNVGGPKESFYIRTPIDEVENLKRSLSLAYGVRGQVIKQRELYLIGRTRVHIDQVEQLGRFLELEVVLQENEPSEDAEQEAETIMRELGITQDQLVDGAYMDLLDD